MIQGLISRFTFSYPRTLAYMLQASEYYVLDYFDWYHSTLDFSAVEKVGKLKYTKKAMVVLATIWVEYLAMIAKVIWFTGSNLDAYGYWPLLTLLLVPFLLPYLAVIPVLVIKYLLQMPYELMIANGLQARIAVHRGVKIAVAGSYGKTTMREILRSVLGADKKVAAPSGSINTLLGINSFMKKLDGDEDVLIFEIGEYYPGDVAHLARIIQPDIGVITGINEAHLKRFGSIEKTVATIYELAAFLTGKPLFVNAENELAKSAARKGDILYSRAGCGELSVKDATSDLTGTTITIARGKETYVVKSQLLGLHLVGSIVAAVEVGLSLGIPMAKLVEGVAATKPFPRRLELVSEKDDIAILDDSYNGNPDGVRAVLDFLTSLVGHRRLYITSGLVEMGDRSREVHLQIGKELTDAQIEVVMLVRTSATKIIAEGLEGSGYKGNLMWFDDTDAAYAALPHLTVRGDVVLLQNNWPDQYK